MTEGQRRASVAERYRPQSRGRSLDDLGAQTLYLPVKVICGGVDISTHKCPFDIKCLSTNQQNWEIALPWPEVPESAEELLEWFTRILEHCAASGVEGEGSISGVSLEFPPRLHKSERAKWHTLADKFDGPVKLKAVSQGAGEDRFLQVISKPPKAERRPISQRTRQIWKWCQDEGGASWGISQGEIEDLLASGNPLPSNIQNVINDRERSIQLLESIERKDEATAVSIVDSSRKAAWLRSKDSGNYPIHEAIHQGLALVVARLALVPGALQQRDAKYRVPLAVAQQLRRPDLVEILAWAAA